MKRVLTETGEDITEAVALLYDNMCNSCEVGSGFLDTEEMTNLIDLSIILGYSPPPINDNSLPMVQLALKYPDQYEVIETPVKNGYRRNLETDQIDPVMLYTIKTRGKVVKGEVIPDPERTTVIPGAFLPSNDPRRKSD